jgi:hypothetical protein
VCVSSETAFDSIQAKLSLSPQQLQQQLQQQPVLSPSCAFKQLSTNSASMHALRKALAWKLPQGPHEAAVGTMTQVRDSLAEFASTEGVKDHPLGDWLEICCIQLDRAKDRFWQVAGGNTVLFRDINY